MAEDQTMLDPRVHPDIHAASSVCWHLSCPVCEKEMDVANIEYSSESQMGQIYLLCPERESHPLSAGLRSGGYVVHWNKRGGFH